MNQKRFAFLDKNETYDGNYTSLLHLLEVFFMKDSPIKILDDYKVKE